MQGAATAKIALIGSPRTGNNRIRRSLADAIGVPHLAHPAIGEFPDPPPDYVVNLHVCRSAAALDWIRASGMAVVALARHPLDALVSAIQLTRQYQDAKQQWLGGGSSRAAMIESGGFGGFANLLGWLRFGHDAV